MNKVVVVTGGSSGIGKEVCLEFAKEGDKVVVCYNHGEKEAKNVCKEVERLGGTPYIHFVDVSNYDSVCALKKDVLKVFGRVDVLVNSAGIACYEILCDMKEEKINQLLQVNLLGTINTCKAFSENMASSRSGKIINISSIWGISGASGETVYSATKAGVIGFSKALAKELGLSNVNVNVVAPGVIKTRMLEGIDKKVLKSLAESTALGRLGEPQDVAGLVSFLASDKANYITGQVITVDGMII